VNADLELVLVSLPALMDSDRAGPVKRIVLARNHRHCGWLIGETSDVDADR
jgi:hypothetical protein